MIETESKLQEVLRNYDKARIAEGYVMSFRRWALYTSIENGIRVKEYGEHVETIYLHEDRRALLVKVQPDGGISVFECV